MKAASGICRSVDTCVLCLNRFEVQVFFLLLFLKYTSVLIVGYSEKKSVQSHLFSVTAALHKFNEGTPLGEYC